jgi:DNA polymerase III subunit alpha
MAEPTYAHLHVHSEYSVLDGACRIPQLVQRAVDLGMPAVGLTDHGSMAGSVELYKAASKVGIKPLLGCEVYVVSDRRQRKREEGERSWSHLTLLAETTAGYHNLVKLCTLGYLEGYYYKPRVDYELLERYADGLICLSGCMAGVTCQALLRGDEPGARAELDRLVSIFGRDDVYVELQDAGMPEHAEINPGLLRIAADAGLPVVGTGDVHYLNAEDAGPHDALLCIQTNALLSDTSRFRFATREFYLKSPAEMQALMARWGDNLLQPTLEIAERCNVELELGTLRLPRFDEANGDSFGMLRRLCEEGLKRRYERIDDELRARLEFELQTIAEMGFADYFLIVWDFIQFAKRNGVTVGPGRGSAAGSLVAYVLAITDLDPISNDLLFERFLNPGRKSMPDIDIDFSVQGRERVFAYVTEKYGRDRVAQIITFSKLQAKASVRDAGRVMGMPYGVVDRIAKLIPEGPGVNLTDCMKPSQELAKACEEDEAARQIVEMARPLEGLTRADSIHAAGVVIGDRPLMEYLPLQQKGAGEAVVTQFTMNDVEALGLLKMDFLGLRNLDVIDEAVRITRESYDVDLGDLSDLPLDDQKTFDMLARGDTLGVFQFESSGMRDALRSVKPTCFDDVVALVALYRPGPMQNIPMYARRKNGLEPTTYLHPKLESVLGTTMGITLYQEQSMLIAKEIAGFTPAEADDLRKAIGKKVKALMASLEPKFLEGCQANGISKDVAKSLWEDNERSADYSFNKAHAACYGLIAYRTAYLKANYPEPYMAALISSVMSTKDKVPFYVAECTGMGIEVLPPDVNTSGSDFVVVDGKIRFGLTAVKGVGEGAVRSIVAAREEGGSFTSVWDMCERVDASLLNKRVLESLIKCGGLDSTGASRRAMLMVFESALAAGQKVQADEQRGQGSIFDLGEPVSAASGSSGRHHPQLLEREFERRELLALEKETLGLYLTSHPLAEVRDQLRRKVDVPLSELPHRNEGEVVTVGGIVASIRTTMTRKGDPMAFIRLDDAVSTVEVVVFSSAYAAAREHLYEDRVLVVKGRVDRREEGETKVVALEVMPFDAVALTGEVRVRVDARTTPASFVDGLGRAIRDFPGTNPVVVEMSTADGPRRLRLGPAYRVRPAPDFFAEVRVLGGEAQLV